jgi:hypothetical protein
VSTHQSQRSVMAADSQPIARSITTRRCCWDGLEDRPTAISACPPAATRAPLPAQQAPRCRLPGATWCAPRCQSGTQAQSFHHCTANAWREKYCVAMVCMHPVRRSVRKRHRASPRTNTAAGHSAAT